MALLLLFICLTASTVGAIAGFGGGVMIKPILDALGILPVSTISFCSGCTVLAMSVSSLIRSRGNGVTIPLKLATPLAIGAALGGLVGKWLFQLIRSSTGQEAIVGGIQSICLTLMTLGVLVYVCKKDCIVSHHEERFPAIVAIGLGLGLISSFLGIGGGPCNVAVLFFFFSMDAKQAAKSSIYLILFSQSASLISTLVTGTVPEFSWFSLGFMMCGGVLGAILGAALSRRMDNNHVEKLLRGLMVIIIGICIWNVLQFFFLR